MRVGFYLQAGNPIYYVYATIMLKSIRDTMPDVSVIQFTDMDSKQLAGVDGVLRRPNAPMSEFRSGHYAAVVGDWLFIDTDVVIKQDVRPLFDDVFEIAVANRNWPHQPTPDGFNKLMPYNAGVVFSRSQMFWNEIHQMVLKDTLTSPWYGDQKALGELVDSGRYNTLVLDGFVYNYPPARDDDPAVHAKIVHAKGNRKGWLLNHFYNEQQR